MINLNTLSSIQQSGIQKEFWSKLKDDKFKINRTPIERLIQMDLFLSFLTIPVEISRDHLGAVNGWTLRKNEKYSLLITGGIMHGGERLDAIQFGNKLSNPYNNYVSPFYIFDILTKEGQLFFLEYYKKDIEQLLGEQERLIEYRKKQVENELEILLEMKNQVSILKA
jgi:hypothetical protein